MARDPECYQCVFGIGPCFEHDLTNFQRESLMPNIVQRDGLAHLYSDGSTTQVSPDGNVYIISPCGELKGIMLHTPQRFIKNVTHLEKCLLVES